MTARNRPSRPARCPANRRGGDDGVMRCDRAREGLSAQLDGEDPGVHPQALDQHLASCPGCRRWHDEAARITRMVRVRPTDPAELVPDFAARVAPAQRTRLWRPVLRIALLLVALAQLTVGVTGLLPPLTGGLHAHPVTGGGHLPGMTGHLGNESAAFNIAIGIALVWIAARPHQARGPLPMLAAFVVVLAGLEILDLAASRVGWGRLVVHLPVVVGLLLAAALTRLRPPTMPAPDDSAARDGWWDAEHAAQHSPADTPRGGHGRGQGSPAARRDLAS
jgi:predicted anti-sigma-YlaC factor YlaD